LAVKAPPPAPLPVIYNWSGFYIGANGGWGESHSCWDFLTPAGVAFAEGCRDRSGGLFGGQIGYRWQANQWGPTDVDQKPSRTW
jgi:outer membrane immunogenic protein